MPPSNHECARLFQQMADIMEMLGVDRFKVNAYAKVARVLSEMDDDITAIGPDARKLQELEGIGKSSALRICEYLSSGQIADHQELLAQIPAGLPALLKIPGLGPKTVQLLWKEGGVTGLPDLVEKLKANSLPEIKGLGEKKLENLRKSLEFAATSQERRRIGEVLPVARYFMEKLHALPGVREVQYAGSLRRGKETIGDLDLLVAAAPGDVAAIMDAFVNFGPVTEVLGRGDTKASIRTFEGLQVDLRVVGPESFGAALMYFTGSKEHNVALRQLAISKGWKLSEYGLFEGERSLAGATEEEVFAALGLAWVPPELREDHGEIARAREGTLPMLVEIGQIKAELHAHTTASDGRFSIRELAELASERGFHTLAVTDHSFSQRVANGLSAERLEAHIVAVREAAAALKGRITLLAGAEVDILADGALDYPNSLLRELDIVVASPHAALTQEPTKATARLLKAIHNPYVTILGHPTGRLVLRRPGLAPDMKQVVAAAAQRGIALEVNANHHRLDLRDNHARLALEAGCKLSVNCDTHTAADLDQLIYGVLTARRAGARAQDVVNTFDAEPLRAWIKSTRA